MMKSKIIFLIVYISLFSFAIKADNVLRTLEVWGKRPLKDIGVERTTFDSLSLRENVALSMADILAFNSSLFVKNYGRATLSTVSFRGTSPSHTQVTWNGMRINNPMLGMTDFSTIPSFFVDKASLLHGTSSVNETGGALGGVVQLSSDAGSLRMNNNANDSIGTKRIGLQYVQGIGSFRTFDEFLRATWTNGTWSTSTRVAYSSSPNDYKYVNHDKKENIYDDNHNIVGQYYPTERNRSGAFKDFNVMQQIYWSNTKGDKTGIDLWYTNMNRELPMLTTDYGEEREFDNRQRQQNLRAVVTWTHSRTGWNLTMNGGYSYTNLKYDYKREISADNWAVMTRSRSRVNTIYAQAAATWFATSQLFLTGNISGHQHFVSSHDKDVVQVGGNSSAIVGYRQARLELSGLVSAKWQPVESLGLSAVLRDEIFGDKTAFIPAFFIDWNIYRPWNVMLKGSVSRNHKFPTLNDLYFMPGGNPDLKDESGFTYDIGVHSQFTVHNAQCLVHGDINWFDSYIDDWILWLPTTKGFFSPRNVKKVHAYGIESRFGTDWMPHRDWTFSINGTYSWTPSINRGEPMSPADQSVGRQLPYVPLHSASITGRVTWRTWSLTYKWLYYSRRYTMSNNDITLTGNLPEYFMNNLVVQKDVNFKPIDLQFKLAVNNLFNEEYLSVLAHPMPGINFEFFVSITPKW